MCDVVAYVAQLSDESLLTTGQVVVEDGPSEPISSVMMRNWSCGWCGVLLAADALSASLALETVQS